MSEIIIRRARLEDVLTIVTLINAGGPPGRPRESLPAVLPDVYRATFEKLNVDSQVSLMVADVAGQVVGTFQLNYLTYLAGQGRDDAQLEAVHVIESARGRGIGSAMLKWAIDHATKRNCRRLQLTTNKARTCAHQFYERLGFVASHEGMKLDLTARDSTPPESLLSTM